MIVIISINQINQKKLSTKSIKKQKGQKKITCYFNLIFN